VCYRVNGSQYFDSHGVFSLRVKQLLFVDRLLNPEDEGTMLHQNARSHLPIDATSQQHHKTEIIAAGTEH